MLAIGVRYLCGWAMATESFDRGAAEWPPHPDRLFMALASAYFEGEATLGERRALEWLERAGPPAIYASAAVQRTVVTAFVPVNDSATPRTAKIAEPVPSSALSVLPEFRARQARQFPTAVPVDPAVFFVWPESPPESDTRDALSRLCRNVIRVGHSASLVQAWLEERPPTATWSPATVGGELRLRITGSGRLPALEAAFEAGIRPKPSLWQGYVRSPGATVKPIQSVFSRSLIVLRQSAGRRLGLESTLQVADTLRKAVMALAKDPLPEWSSGHKPDGRPTDRAHLAIVPLPHVDREHADGHLLGAALVLPGDVPLAEVGQVLAPVMQVAASAGLRVFNGRMLDATFSAGSDEGAPIGLAAETWTQPSRRWATITPIALDRFPKSQEDAARLVALACTRIDLPPPSDVEVSRVSLVRGVPPAPSFTPLPSRAHGGATRYHVHAIITFDVPVAGPVLLGAGRYRGYGFCRPLREDGGR